MDWTTDDEIAAPLKRAERVLFDAEALARMPAYVPEFERVTVQRLVETDTHIERALHVRPQALPWFARGVDRAHTEWVEHLTWDRAAHGGVFTIVPTIPPGWLERFDAHGTYTLVPRDEGHVRRTVTGTLSVRTLGGALIARVAAGMIRAQFRHEAAWLAACAFVRE